MMISRLMSLCILLAIVSVSYGKPLLEGSPSDLASYLNNVRKEVTLNGTASKNMKATSAKVTLLVKTESPKLAKALKANSELRESLKNELVKFGFQGADIVESSFSSTPEYGLFGDEPKSYKVNNTVSVVVRNNEQLINVANIADSNLGIRYLSTNIDFKNKKELEKKLRLEALKEIENKENAYTKRLPIKLKPIGFEESVTSPQQDNIKLNTRKSAVSNVYRDERATLGETEFRYHIAVTYQVVPL